MPQSIVLTGLAANDPVPGVYEEVSFAQGPAAGYGGTRPILLMGNKTSAGSAAVDTGIYGPDTTVPCQTEADVISLFGTGSELHRMFLRAAKIVSGTTVPIYLIAVTESAGTAASGTITYATNASANGTTRVYVGDEFVDVAITSGDTPTNIASNVAAAINAKTKWAVTASPAVGVVTITARQKGPRGNWIRFQASITAGIGTTATAATDAFLTSGATADSNTTALTTILAQKYYYIASAAEDATQFGALNTQVLSQALPTSGIRQRCFAGSVDTLANATTIATGINSARAEVIWQKNGLLTPSELAAYFAALYAVEETGDAPRCNFSGFPVTPTDQTFWAIPKPRDATAIPTRANIVSALDNGLTPLGAFANGNTYLVKRITTRSLNGAVADYRIRDAHKVTVCDFFADDLHTKIALQFGGKNLSDDPPKGARPVGGQVVTPSQVKAAILKLVDDYGDLGLLQRLQEIKDAVVVQRETSNTSRVSARIPLEPVDVADVFANAIQQVA